MRDLQILMPMGGLGRRFRDVGISTPKPLIPVLGVPMFKRALASFDPFDGHKRHIVVVRADDNAEFGLAGKVTEVDPGARIVLLEHDTRGAVETCLLARDQLDPELALVIMDCDIAFYSPHYFDAITQSLGEGGVDGLLLSFDSKDPRYSFAEVDASGMVVRTAEKKAISSHALMGAYFFTRAEVFLTAAEALMERQISSAMPEYYVSLVYNELIASGKKVGLVSGHFDCFGTPEELKEFEQR